MVVIQQQQAVVGLAEADLGMFGRTGAPTKMRPHKRTGKFLQHSNMPEIICVYSGVTRGVARAK